MAPVVATQSLSLCQRYCAADAGIGQNCFSVGKRSDFSFGNQVYFTATTIQRGLSSRALLISKFQDRISRLHVRWGNRGGGK
jgi:hypothetical protein